MSSHSLNRRSISNKNMAAIDNTPSTSQALQRLESTKNQTTTINNEERTCWICFCTDEDNRSATWIKPCKCRGTMQWVHQNCLYRWIDEKQRGNILTKPVVCPQCQTEYMIISPSMGAFGNLLETCDFFIKRLSPFLAAGIFVSSLYWSAVTYGAVTYVQVFGHEKGIEMLEETDVLTLLIGLPAIPVSLILGRMIQWERAIITLIRNRRNIVRKLPLLNLILSYSEDEDDDDVPLQQPTQNPALPPYTEPTSGTRIFCGALLLPTISTIVGSLLFQTVDNQLHRALLGGLAFTAVKGFLRIYLIDRQYMRRKKRRIVDYNEENLEAYKAQQNSNNNAINSPRLLVESSSLQLLSDF